MDEIFHINSIRYRRKKWKVTEIWACLNPVDFQINFPHEVGNQNNAEDNGNMIHENLFIVIKGKELIIEIGVSINI